MTFIKEEGLGLIMIRPGKPVLYCEFRDQNIYPAMKAICYEFQGNQHQTVASKACRLVERRLYWYLVKLGAKY